MQITEAYEHSLLTLLDILSARNHNLVLIHSSQFIDFIIIVVLLEIFHLWLLAYLSEKYVCDCNSGILTHVQAFLHLMWTTYLNNLWGRLEHE